MTIRELFQQAEMNLARVRGLIAFYDQQVALRPGSPTTQATDLLRAAVVFLHATLDDFLRTLAGKRLPLAGAEALKDIPFAIGDGKKVACSLVELSGYRGQTVEEVISNSVDLYLDRESFNSVGEIAALFARLGLSNKDLTTPHGQNLSALISRRHLIAHRFDAERETTVGQHRYRSLQKATVVAWTETVNRFLDGVAVATGETPSSERLN